MEDAKSAEKKSGFLTAFAGVRLSEKGERRET
jgi:hypothetical protein